MVCVAILFGNVLTAPALSCQRILSILAIVLINILPVCRLLFAVRCSLSSLESRH